MGNQSLELSRRFLIREVSRKTYMTLCWLYLNVYSCLKNLEMGDPLRVTKTEQRLIIAGLVFVMDII
jgi:hypothetical protein